MSEVTCQASVHGLYYEVTLVTSATADYGDKAFILPAGTKVDAPCQTTVPLAETTRVGDHLTWECPVCGFNNSVEAD